MSQSPYERAVDKDSFRILLLEPDKNNQPICCTLTPYNFFNNVTYEAISYAWGGELFKTTIRCNSTNLHITHDLELCLKALRSENEARSLWIDQICINQDDLEEKSAQVSVMGPIYRSAARVLVWLGPASPYSGQALSFVVELCEAFLAYYRYHGDEVHPFRSPNESIKIEPTDFELPAQSDPRWMALTELLNRPWFSRYWIIQEVMVNDEVIVQCGDGQIGWSILRRLNECLSRSPALLSRLCSPDIIPAGPGLLAALNVAEVVVKRSNDPKASTESPSLPGSNCLHSISLLIQVFSVQSVKHGCDRVYSLLGIANWPIVQHIKIDYRLSTSQVYMDFTVKSMEYDGNLDHLNYVEYSEETALEGLPSWVPDWTNAPKSKPKGIKHMYYHHFRASGPQPIHIPFRVSGKKLLVRARLIDVISSPRMNYPTDVVLNLAHLDPDFDQAISCKEQELEFYERVESTINACQPYSTGETTMTVMCRLLTRDWLWRPQYNGPTIGDYQDFFRETREYTRWLRKLFHKPQEYGNRMPIDEWCLLHPEPSTKHIDMVSFTKVLPSQVCGNAIVKTRAGYMANVPEQAKTGDVLAIVNGCKTPFVLRQQGPAEYILIGDCYVHGIMYGEAMEMGSEEKEIALV